MSQRYKTAKVNFSPLQNFHLLRYIIIIIIIISDEEIRVTLSHRDVAGALYIN